MLEADDLLFTRGGASFGTQPKKQPLWGEKPTTEGSLLSQLSNTDMYEFLRYHLRTTRCCFSRQYYLWSIENAY